MTRTVSGRTRRHVVSGAAGALAVAGLTGLGLGLAQQEAAPPSPVSSRVAPGQADNGTAHGGHHHGPAPAPSRPATPPAARATGGGAAAYARPVGTLMERSAPVRVRIPTLKVSSDVIDLGLQRDRRMEVPRNGTQTGWYTGSPTPGELGPAVLAAHVTWQKKPAVFFSLGAMRPGQRVEVDRRDGTTGVFEVVSVGQYPKRDFPTEAVYGTVDHAALRLITCGGVFDGETGHHVDNVVVFARLVGSRPVAQREPTRATGKDVRHVGVAPESDRDDRGARMSHRTSR